MNEAIRLKALRTSLILFGAVFFLIYPLGIVWPSGWVWHDGEGTYYLQMICGLYAVIGFYMIKASKDPDNHGSLISFVIWSSVVHALIMAVQAVLDDMEHGHLLGDVPALLLVAGTLWCFSPRRSAT